jgi:hypothetical protein
LSQFGNASALGAGLPRRGCRIRPRVSTLSFIHKAEKSWYRASAPAYIKHRYRLEAYATLRRRAVAEGPWSDRQDGLEISLEPQGSRVA